MKVDIHPTYNTDTKIKCACGATFEVGSTTESYSVEICSKCHPFYTGKQKLIDTAGRVDKFKSRMQATDKMRADQEARDAGKTKKETVEEKMTRKAEEKEAVKEAEKAKKEEAKMKSAKKKAEEITVKPAEEAKDEEAKDGETVEQAAMNFDAGEEAEEKPAKEAKE